MTFEAVQRMGRFPQPRNLGERPRERLRRFLDTRYRGRPAVLAGDVPGLGKKAAENLLLGHWPSEDTLSAIIQRFGRDVIAAVFEPDIDAVLARLAEDERRAEEAFLEARKRRRQAEGVDEGRSFAPAEAEDERDPLTGDLLEWGGLQ